MVEQRQARELRALGWKLADIADKLEVAKSSVSLWVRDVEFEPSPRRTGPRRRGPNLLQRRKSAEIAGLLAEGRERIGQLSERDFLVAGAALYAGEGAKREGAVIFANSDPRMISFFCAWLRRFFQIDESRMRVQVYLHEGLDLDVAEEHWAAVTGVPRNQFRKPYRAVPDPSIRTTKHEFGCVYVRYACTRTHRAIMGLCWALLSSEKPSGVAQSAARVPVKH